jgi:hypothetical protein
VVGEVRVGAGEGSVFLNQVTVVVFQAGLFLSYQNRKNDIL